MSVESILRCRAASYMRTSTVVMTEQEYQNFLTQVIDFNYPNLRNSPYLNINSEDEIEIAENNKLLRQNRNLWMYLTFKTSLSSLVKVPDIFDPYEWWLTTPVGPKSCSRDIGDVRDLLINWIKVYRYRKENQPVLTVNKGDEWDGDVERAIIEFQKQYQDFLIPTGYADCETIRRLRMQE